MVRLAAVGMVRNEADIIEAFVRHTLRFVDELRLVDYLSTDATPAILEKLQAEGLPLIVTRHAGNSQVQEILTTKLAQEAFAASADWVIPLDCDEFIAAPSPELFRQAVIAARSARVAWWPWVSMVPCANDDKAEIDPVRRIRHRCAVEDGTTPKCMIHRSLADGKTWQFAPGNHHVRLADMDPLPMAKLPDAFALRHYPVRGLDQLMSKMVLGRLAWLPGLEKGSNVSFHTRDFVERLKTGWLPNEDDVTAYAANYQSPKRLAQTDLVEDPIAVQHDLRYTSDAVTAFLPRFLAWAENLVLAQKQTAPAAIFHARPRAKKPAGQETRSQRTIAPDAALAFNAANAAMREGKLEAVLTNIEMALKHAPILTEAYVLRGRALRRLGDESAARAAYDAAVELEPANFDALLEQGNVLRSLGEPDKAAVSYTAAMAVRPLDARPAVALARLMEEQPGQEAAERAAVAFHKALDRAEANADPSSALAGLYRDMARFRLDRADLPRALDALRQARLLVGHGSLAPLIDLDCAEVYLRLGMTEEAQALMERLSATEDPSLLRALAQLAYRFNFWAEAVAILTRWTVLRPDDAQAHLDLADMQVKAWLLEDALTSLDRAEASGAVPSVASAALRASIANRMGDAETALGLYEGLVAEGQESFASNAAMSLLYADSVTPQEVAERHRALLASWGQEARTRESFNADHNPDRPLRIGLVSGDLHHQHPVNIFMQPLLARWDQTRLPLTIYNTGTTVDDQTRLARRRAGSWRDLSTAQLPARVEADQIDILIDLAGHTAGGALRAFAKRMAPVQASFLGYPGSTGVPNIDWLIGDPVVTPPEADHLCSERVMRLPNTVFCFAPEVDYPLPDFAATIGRPLTFGSFNNIPKLTPRTIQLWANVLHAVPGSRLLLRAPSFKDASAIARFCRLFAEHNIDAARLIFRGPVGLDVMMQAYCEIDIALDPVPYCGGTTSLQALWMGVPVLTMLGGQFVSRMGASFMTAAGLPDWVARDGGDYLDKAIAVAQDKAALLALKRGLRDQLLAQPGWNSERYAEDFGAALRHMWNQTIEV